MEWISTAADNETTAAKRLHYFSVSCQIYQHRNLFLQIFPTCQFVGRLQPASGGTIYHGAAKRLYQNAAGGAVSIEKFSSGVTVLVPIVWLS